ncbi:MAG TPA: thiamine pyrophosphate-dependent enzyme, partial [Chloroflexia bacterium]
PDFDFVQIAAAFGVPNGRRVRDPHEVMPALEEAFDYVLNKKQSYVLELFTDRNPKSVVPSTVLEGGDINAEHNEVEAPPLDVFYHKEANLL